MYFYLFIYLYVHNICISKPLSKASGLACSAKATLHTLLFYKFGELRVEACSGSAAPSMALAATSWIDHSWPGRWQLAETGWSVSVKGPTCNCRWCCVNVNDFLRPNQGLLWPIVAFNFQIDFSHPSPQPKRGNYGTYQRKPCSWPQNSGWVHTYFSPSRACWF